MKYAHRHHHQPLVNQIRSTRLGLWLPAVLVMALLAAVTFVRQGHSAAAALNGPAALEHLKQDGSYNSLAAAVNATRYHARAAGAGFAASNPAQQFEAAFEHGLQLKAGEMKPGSPPWQFKLKLTGVGYGDNLAEVSGGVPTANGNRVEISNGALTEWYVNQPEGLEQGFTLQTPPNAARRGGARLRLALRLAGDLHAEASANQQAITLKDQQGHVLLSYDHLAAWDAQHQALPATMTASGNTITLEVDDARAVYPVTIDPLLAQQAKLTAADGAAGDQFGKAVAVSGDYAVVGAAEDNAQMGAAYVFVRSGSTWTQQAKLIALDGAASDRFGVSVSIDGPTAVIGASGADFEGNVNHGAAYVFVRSGASWSQQAKLAVSDGAQVTAFGAAVAVNGDTALIGTPHYGLGGETGRGAGYVYLRAGVTWTLQQKLLASDGVIGDNFGNSVALDGSTALLGALGANIGAAADQGAAYVFTRSGALWSQQAKLVGSGGAANDQFGGAVALSGDTAVIGARLNDPNGSSNQGAAYVFTRSGATWSQQQKLTAADGGDGDAFGLSVAISGDLIVVGSDDYDLVGYQNLGAVYLFTRNGGAWSQRQKLRAADGGAYDYFGSAVAVSGNTVIGGAYKADVNGSVDQGAAYAFVVVNDVAQAQKLFDANGKLNAELGNSVAIDSDTAVVGAHFDTIGAIFPGSVYVFLRNGATWTLQQKLTPADGASSDEFGFYVAVSGDTLIAGAPFKPNGAASQQGAAYIFVRNNGVWAQQQKLLANDGAANDRFGLAVALNGDTALVGAPAAKIGANGQQGAVYAFTRSGANWSQQQKLTASDGAAGDYFGRAIAMSGYAAIIGAPNDDINAATDRGSAYVFNNSGGATWTQQQKLTASDGAANHVFGFAVALDGPTALVGAYGNGGGAAYAFAYDGATWNQQQELFPNDPAAGNQFGIAVGLSGELAAIGASNYDTAQFQNQGAAYLFERQGSVWTQRQKLTAADAAANDNFGSAIALAGPEILVGAPSDDIALTNQGSVYYFRYAACSTIILNAMPGNGTVGTSYNQQLSATGGVGPYQYSLTNGTLPPGLTLTQSGLLSGTPTFAGTYNFTVKAAIASLCSGSQSYTVVISGNCQALALNPATLPNIQANSIYQVQLSATGGTAPYNYTAAPATLPPGITLDSATGVLSGAATTLGAYNFSVTVIDAIGCSATRNYSTTVYSCSGFDYTPNGQLPGGTTGQAYNLSFTPTGGTAPYNFVLAQGTPLPPGLTLNAATGVISGTPTQAGNFGFQITLFDSLGCEKLRAYNLSIAQGCPTITINPAGLNLATVGTAFNQQLSAQGGTAPYAFSVAGGALPAGLTLANDGSLSGTPTLASNGSFTVQATDANGCFTTKAYNWSVVCPAITFLPASLPSATTGTAYNQNIVANSGALPFTYSLPLNVLPPPGLSLSSAGVLSGTPTQAGVFNLSVRASYGGCTGSQDYTLTINAACPTITVAPATLPTVFLDTPYSQQLMASGGAAPYTFSIVGSSLPAPGLTITPAGLLTGTIPAGAGVFGLQVKAVDANGCSQTQGYNMTIMGCPGINVSPNSPLPAGMVNSVYNQTITASGGAAPYTYSVFNGSLPAGLTLSNTGALTGTPTASGLFQFDIKATDASGCTNSRPYSLTINAACQTFTFNPPTLSTGTTGVAYSQQITVSGGVSPYNFSITNGALPAGLTLGTAGLLSGTPTQTSGVNLTIQVTDVNGCTSSKVYLLTVNCATITVNPATLPAGTVGAAYNQTLTQTGGTSTVTFSLSNGALPAGLNLSSGGVLSGTPTQAGSFPITVQATDAASCGGSRQYTLAINAACPAINISPNPPSPAFVGVAYNHTFNATGGSAPYTFSIAQGPIPDGLTLSPAGVLSGTPTGNNGGGFAFTVKATDANGCTGQVQFGLTIGSCPTITVNPATLPNGQMGVAYNQNITASGGVAPHSYSVSVGNLPAGLTLSSAGALSGTPSVSGQFNFTIKATDANGCLGTRAYTLTLNGCPTITITPATLPNGATGTAYNQTLTPSGGAQPYAFSIQSGALPTGLTLSGAGVISGTPSVNGPFNLTVKATDANGCTGTQTYTLTINAGCPAITVNPATLPVATAGVAYAQTFTQSGGNGAISYSVSAGALPNGMTLNASSGALSGMALTSGVANFTVKATDANGCFGTRQYTLTIRPKAKADFDGDGKSDLSVWTGATGNWAVRNSGNNQVQNLNWGAGYAPYNDVIVPGDYDGDGKADHAIWRGADSIWYIRKSSDGQAILQLYGTSNAPYFDLPTPGDFDGDGKTDLAVFRPSTGTWYVRRSSNNTDLIVQHGQNGDVPVAADYDGDGKTDFAVFRPSAVNAPNWLILQSSTNTVVALSWGAGYAPYFDVPVPADYDGDGKADLAIWRGADSIWYIRPSANVNAPVLQLWGTSNAPYFDTPCPADYDGDGKADIAVWRKDGTWFVLRSSNNTNMIQVHGQNGDTPVPAKGVW